MFLVELQRCMLLLANQSKKKHIQTAPNGLASTLLQVLYIEKKVMDDLQINKCVCYEKRLHTEPLLLHLQIKDNGYFQNFTGGSMKLNVDARLYLRIDSLLTCHENFWTLPKEVSPEWKLIKTQLVIGSPRQRKRTGAHRQ
nr:hypothetical protein [Tanacetum cinerariifolium]